MLTHPSSAGRTAGGWEPEPCPRFLFEYLSGRLSLDLVREKLVTTGHEELRLLQVPQRPVLRSGPATQKWTPEPKSHHGEAPIR
jgi:hypothetical protein